MNDSIELSEYRSSQCLLSAVDEVYLRSRYGEKFEIGPRLSDDSIWINPQQYVCVLGLPSGRSLVVHPKIPVRNIFQMFARAYDLRNPFEREIASLNDIRDLIELVIMHFADLVSDRIRRGLYRDYVEREDNLNTVRGRIVMREQVQRNAVLQHRMYCRFTEFTHDIAENQIIRQVVHRLIGFVTIPRLRIQLQQLDAQLGDVSPSNHTTTVLDTMHYHRLNDDYLPIHRLCRMFLEGLSLEDQAGGIDLRAFVLDMNKLFEQFIGSLAQVSRPIGGNLVSQAHRHLDVDLQIDIRPDLLLRRDGVDVLIADTKYKDIDQKDPGQADLYQITAYCLTQNVSQGVLIYPTRDATQTRIYQIRNADITVRALFVNLGIAHTEFEDLCRDTAIRIWSLTDPPAVIPFSHQLTA